MDRRFERDRGERGNWSREWGNDRNRETRGSRYEDDDQRGGSSGYGENRNERGRYGNDWETSDYPYRGRSSSYYGALGYRDDRERQGSGRSGGYDPYEESGERWGRGQSGEFGDRPFRSSGSDMPAYFGAGGYYGGFSGGNAGRDQWGGRYGEGRYRDRGIDDDRYGDFRRGESRESGGFLSRMFRRGPKGYTRSDDRIREDISERLYHNADIDSSEVSVNVSGGKVTLEGTVPQRWMRHAIENEADRCSGVRDIDNNIRVQSGEQESQQTGAQGTTGSSTTTTTGSSRTKLS